MATTATANTTPTSTIAGPTLTNSVTPPMFNVMMKDAKSGSSSYFDDEWVKSTFIITDGEMASGTSNKYEEWIRKNRYSTSADHKFSSTSPGMSLGVNPKPQFTRYCDVRSKGRQTDRPDVVAGNVYSPTGLGMGGYYSTAIDDNQQRVFFRFGVPSYLPLPIWIAKSFDVNKAVMQGRGVITSEFLSAVNLISKFFVVVSNPLMSLAMAAVSILTANARFYSVKSTMYIYWATVENTLNAMVTRRTMLPHILQDYTYKLDTSVVGEPEKISQKFIDDISSYIPDIINPATGRISVFAIALRSQASYNKIKLAELTDRVGKKITDVNETDDIGVTTNLPMSGTTNTKKDFINGLFNKAASYLLGSEEDNTVKGLNEGSAGAASTIGYNPIYTDAQGVPLSISLDPNDPTESVDSKLIANINTKSGKMQQYSQYLLAELTDGAAFAVFNVEHTGSVGEQFSSSFGSNPIEATFNSFSAKARNLSSMLSSISSIPVVGDALGLAADAGALVLSNASFGFANPLLALAYGVNVSMPKVWESSSAQLPQSSYKIRLVSPYGNAYSQLFNIYMPLSMILAGALPRATGNSSYVSPFFCECYDRGRNNIMLGMIDRVSLTRGTSNLAFTRSGHPNAIDVEMSVANLDEIVSLDVTSNGVISKAMDALDPDVSETPFTSYINTLAAVDVYTQAFRFPSLRLRFAEKLMNIKSITDPDPAAYAAMTVNTVPGLGFVKDLLGDPVSMLQSLNSI